MISSTRTTPSLRIAELAIINFRTFRDRTVIRFRDAESAPADAVATFHGDNGSGKSNALAALDLFFAAYLRRLLVAEPVRLQWDQDAESDLWGKPLIIRYRDRPTGAAEATVLEVTFADERLGRRSVTLVPSGEWVRVEADVRDDDDNDALIRWLQRPLGPDSYPFAVLDARRRAAWLTPEIDRSHAALMKSLFMLRTSKDPNLRSRWRAFVEVLQSFDAFKGKDISVDLPLGSQDPEITVEEQGRTVLSLDELSSGERQIILLCATILTSNAAVIALEEPELSLDAGNQRHLMRVIKEQILQKGLVDQIIIESHVPSFDGPRVIRFKKSLDGTTVVERAGAPSPMSEEVERAARAQGATQRWVTADGYTQLPERMREELAIGRGRNVWFMPGARRWEAWPEEELERLFGGDSEDQT